MYLKPFYLTEAVIILKDSALLPPKVYMSGSGWTGDLWHITSLPDLFSYIVEVPLLIAMPSYAAYIADIATVWFHATSLLLESSLDVIIIIAIIFTASALLL